MTHPDRTFRFIVRSALPAAFLLLLTSASWAGIPPQFVCPDQFTIGVASGSNSAIAMAMANQIIAPPGCESRLFAFGRIIENELGFSHRRPKLP